MYKLYLLYSSSGLIVEVSLLDLYVLNITVFVNISYFVEFLLLDRFDNILGTKTIESLVYLSSEIRSIFCHPTIVDRIAAMLNYFLLHLVGPNKKNFKVSRQHSS